jgi:hypothetical protein
MKYFLTVREHTDADWNCCNIIELTSPMPWTMVHSLCGTPIHKSISDQDVSEWSHHLGNLNKDSMLTNDSNVYVAMSGFSTPAQRHIVKSQCMIDVSEFKEVHEWLRVNNLNFANFKEFDDCPSPILVEDKSSVDEESENSTLEKQIEIQFWFPNNGDPTSSNSVLIPNQNLLILY